MPGPGWSRPRPPLAGRRPPSPATPPPAQVDPPPRPARRRVEPPPPPGGRKARPSGPPARFPGASTSGAAGPGPRAPSRSPARSPSWRQLNLFVIVLSNFSGGLCRHGGIKPPPGGQVGQPLRYNVLYRSFCRMGWEDAIPDDTTRVRFRQRLGEARNSIPSNRWQLPSAPWAPASLPFFSDLDKRRLEKAGDEVP
ncbi:MAG: hypothetical protein DIU76_06445 [Bacillota bacterium]|nr:MAG: hypothetical protein DIU76_06445 [Bacillota bacterium]